MTARRIAITGVDGFIGKNLRTRLGELDRFEVVPLGSDSTTEDLEAAMSAADAVVHLAGTNRPQDPADFMVGNRDSVANLTRAIASSGRRTPVILTSSIRAVDDSDYGVSKRAAEDALSAFTATTGVPGYILRLPNVFGKWCRPNYNSAVATFCHNVARGLPITVNDPSAPLSLIHVDDVVTAIIDLLDAPPSNTGHVPIAPVYETTVGAVANLILGFAEKREQTLIDEVGVGLTRALYATYVAALPNEAFSYPLVAHGDARGVFTEMLRTPTSGQFSYFTARPGVTRGGHYHHTKVEKFLVLSGTALFRFRHILTNETHEIQTRGGEPVVVETIPGWTHDITNIGDTEMVVMLWANEIFDRARPDTIAMKV